MGFRECGNRVHADLQYAMGYGGGGGGGGFGGGGGGAAPVGPGTTGLTQYTNSEGLFSLAATARSDDGKVTLSFATGVLARAKDGGALRSVTVLPAADPPAAPQESQIIGLVYDCAPEGATFTPAISLTFNYDASKLPDGLQEKNLILATWDGSAKKWVELKGTVDTTAHTITVSIEHFSAYAIIAHTRPASFTISDISVVPGEVEVGAPVTISVTVSNSGDLAGSCQVNLRINAATDATRDVSISGGGTETATFSAVRSAAGTYAVDVNGRTASFTVRQPPVPVGPTFRTGNLSITPAHVSPGANVSVSFLVSNTGQASGTYHATLKIDGVAVETMDLALAPGASQTAKFDVVKTDPGAYSVDVGGLSAAFVVTPLQRVPERVINWWLIAGIVAAFTTIGSVIGFGRSTRLRYIPTVPWKVVR